MGLVSLESRDLAGSALEPDLLDIEVAPNPVLSLSESITGCQAAGNVPKSAWQLKSSDQKAILRLSPLLRPPLCAHSVQRDGCVKSAVPPR